MRQRTILVVEDNEICLAAVRTALEGAGYVVEAMETAFGLSRTLNSLQPDLVLLDVEMPALRGDTVVSITKSHAKHCCPIVLHSSIPVLELAKLAKTSGAGGYVSKCANQDDLISAIQPYLSA